MLQPLRGSRNDARTRRAWGVAGESKRRGPGGARGGEEEGEGGRERGRARERERESARGEST
eukprot:scaffold140200_cov30-Tisochrysis_lutea.AAC.3